MIGYILLAAALIGTLFLLPLVTPDGLSEAEMQSTVTSMQTNLGSFTAGEIIDLPYHALQHLSVNLLGLTAYAIKLPSIIIGIVLAILLILLLNRWFKNNVALLSSIITVLATPFLYLAGSGTPLIMLVFWPTFLLWLGSKIQGEKRPKPIYCFIFAFTLLFSLLTPHLLYMDAFIILFVLVQPSLRLVIKTLPRIPLVVIVIIILAGLGAAAFSFSHNPATLKTLALSPDFNIADFPGNLLRAGNILFSFRNEVESTFLAPLIGLPLLALAITGLISTARGFLASRNAIASSLILYTILLAGFAPENAILIILPIAILIAHGIRYLLDHWYGLFPENPYARIFAIFPLSLLLGLMIYSDISHFVFGYRYSPSVANEFTDDLALVNDHLEADTTFLVNQNSIDYDFYKILERGHKNITVTDVAPSTGKIASLRKWQKADNLKIDRIITSPKSQESDRIYLYSVKQEVKE